MMIKYTSQPEEIQYKDLLNGLQSEVSSNSYEQQVANYLGNQSKQLFDISKSSDIVAYNQSKQCNNKYHYDGKFCAAGAK
jgi:hypothetical protein